MSFWNTSDGSSATDTGTEFDAGGGNFDPIADGTSVLAIIDEASWDEDRQNNEYLKIRWSVLKPETYENRKIFQKMWVTDENPNAKDAAKKRDKDLKMLSAIDANAGGKLAKKAGKPTDDELALALTGKPMVIRLGVWEMNGDNGPMSGNWVQKVSPKTAEISAAAPATRSARKPAPVFDTDLDDDVPF